mmetsp:Transcript_5804/g.12706  ORF Transcript_5804/g.12706 Transcript_5804/m.12706 type:complete len:84 (+) Transcript_5804:231-482(+)
MDWCEFHNYREGTKSENSVGRDFVRFRHVGISDFRSDRKTRKITHLIFVSWGQYCIRDAEEESSKEELHVCLICEQESVSIIY